MIKSKTKIKKQIKNKTNEKLAELILEANKNEKWREIAGILSGPLRKKIEINLDKLDKLTKENEKVLIPGKILAMGNISKKIKIIALNFSEKAKEKLIKSGCEVSDIYNEIKFNPDAKGFKVLK
jgi:large subunit ribosomal protein L18e